jgi:hypothetical protein
LAELKTTVQGHFNNLICNFKAPDLEHFQLWKRYVQWCKDNGQDVCRVTLDQVAAFMAGVNGAKEAANSVGAESIVTSKGQVINIKQQNTFVYQVGKPRRAPFDLSCVKPEFRRSISSLAQDAYVMDRARRLGGEFSFHDFRELDYDLFRRIVVRLRRKGRIITYPNRSVPQIYMVAENLADQKRCPSTIQ